ncbi:hypothetical protein [Streptantibioticus ferralitis]|uniref:Uncharacterized protein n=1 Tax=Streptantibioticus ferralitis TaxID=236510 RepID=A0ABT5YXM7_9ACTN|nr:hypothetical protein [Streptantibioticus ferralitis]MDF2255585.1 hypothetical protein [Streptantibioticus ferralitis]
MNTCRQDTHFTQTIKLDRLSENSRICARTQAGDIPLVTLKGVAPKPDPGRYVLLDTTVRQHAMDTNWPPLKWSWHPAATH